MRTQDTPSRWERKPFLCRKRGGLIAVVGGGGTTERRWTFWAAWAGCLCVMWSEVWDVRGSQSELTDLWVVLAGVGEVLGAGECGDIVKGLEDTKLSEDGGLAIAKFFEGDGLKYIADGLGDALLEFFDQEAVLFVVGFVHFGFLIAKRVTEQIEDLFEADLVGWACEAITTDGTAHSAHDSRFAEGDKELFEVLEGDFLAFCDDVQFERMFVFVVHGEIDKGADGVFCAG